MCFRKLRRLCTKGWNFSSVRRQVYDKPTIDTAWWFVIVSYSLCEVAFGTSVHPQPKQILLDLVSSVSVPYNNMCCLEYDLYFYRWLRHSCGRWRSSTAVLPAPQTRILSGSRTIRPGSVSPWELCRQTSVLLRAIFCRIQKLHRYVTEHSLTAIYLRHFFLPFSFLLC